jgi:hypothetical protein
MAAQCAFVWQTPTASNNAGATWYLVFFVNFGGTANTQGFTIQACETYTVATHLYNATMIETVGGVPPNVPGPGTTPPYAQVFSTVNAIGTVYTSQWQTFGNIATGTSNFLVAANRDGFFLSCISGLTYSMNTYVGTGTTLVSNPSLSDPVPLFHGDWSIAALTTSCTREPGWTGQWSYWGNYTPSPFMPATNEAVSTMQGSVNSTPGDGFLVNNTPVGARIGLCRTAVSSGGLAATGMLRAVLPQWVQWIPQVGCTWGDTVTEGADTLTYMGGTNNAWLWVDTTAA